MTPDLWLEDSIYAGVAWIPIRFDKKSSTWSSRIVTKVLRKKKFCASLWFLGFDKLRSVTELFDREEVEIMKQGHTGDSAKSINMVYSKSEFKEERFATRSLMSKTLRWRITSFRFEISSLNKESSTCIKYRQYIAVARLYCIPALQTKYSKPDQVLRFLYFRNKTVSSSESWRRNHDEIKSGS